MSVLEKELGRLCHENNITLRRTREGLKLTKINPTYGEKGVLVSWNLVLNQDKPTVRVNHRDDCPFWESDEWWDGACDCPREVTPTSPEELARIIVKRVME